MINESSFEKIRLKSINWKKLPSFYVRTYSLNGLGPIPLVVGAFSYRLLFWGSISEVTRTVSFTLFSSQFELALTISKKLGSNFPSNSVFLEKNWWTSWTPMFKFFQACFLNKKCFNKLFLLSCLNNHWWSDCDVGDQSYAACHSALPLAGNPVKITSTAWRSNWKRGNQYN